MNDLFNKKITVPAGVLRRELSGESVILNLQTESYFGLDEVGSEMWKALTASPSIELAFNALAENYDVDPERLRLDLDAYIQKLVALGLLQVDAV